MVARVFFVDARVLLCGYYIVLCHCQGIAMQLLGWLLSVFFLFI